MLLFLINNDNDIKYYQIVGQWEAIPPERALENKSKTQPIKKKCISKKKKNHSKFNNTKEQS